MIAEQFTIIYATSILGKFSYERSYTPVTCWDVILSLLRVKVKVRQITSQSLFSSTIIDICLCYHISGLKFISNRSSIPLGENLQTRIQIFQLHLNNDSIYIIFLFLHLWFYGHFARHGGCYTCSFWDILFLVNLKLSLASWLLSDIFLGIIVYKIILCMHAEFLIYMHQSINVQNF